VPVDFSARTWNLRIWDKAQSQEVLNLNNANVTGDNTGRITITIPAATTAALMLGTPTRYLNSIALSDYVYSLDSTDVAGGMVRVAEGIFVISHDIE
jgi:hypothetical protein